QHPPDYGSRAPSTAGDRGECLTAIIQPPLFRIVRVRLPQFSWQAVIAIRHTRSSIRHGRRRWKAPASRNPAGAA
ncbi:MAG: hypothetical protein AAFW68_08475, partial [Pseudomonadota bacterium]